MIDVTDLSIATPQRIEQATLELFFERGFPATTMREIGLACGISAAALYNHFASKEQLLASILERVHDELEVKLRDARDAAGDDPRDQLKALMRAQALFHTDHTLEARVSNHEIQWLPEPARSQVVETRRRMRAWFEEVITEGVHAGVFDVADVKATVKAILYMGIGISEWFVPGGPMGAQEVAELYASLALRMAGARA